MASSGKKKTTMAKLNREARMRERRLDKQARKDARKAAAKLGDQADTLGESPEHTDDDFEGPREDAEAPLKVSAA